MRYQPTVKAVVDVRADFAVEVLAALHCGNLAVGQAYLVAGIVPASGEGE